MSLLIKSDGSSKAVDGVANTRKVLVHNTNHAPINVARKIIPAGEQAWVDAADVTPGVKKYVIGKAEKANQDDSGEELEVFDPELFLARSLKDMEPEIAALSKDALELLKTTENAADGTPRKNVVDAIDAALIAVQA